MTSTSKCIVIIGAGISGLAAAHKIAESYPMAEIVVLEASPRCGGVIETQKLNEFLLELGPDSIVTQKPWALDLIQRLGLNQHILETEKTNRRTYIAWDGKLQPLPDGFVMLAPTNFVSFFQSNLFSLAGKLRMAMEMFVPKQTDNGDESLAQFVRRRFGQEALERVAQPMIGGIYTADPEKLSLAATMPRFLDLEQKYGSVIAGLMQAKDQASGARYSLFVTLKEGLGLLIDRLVASLPKDSIRTGVNATAIRKPTERFVIETNNGAIEADGVIIATPSYQASKILDSLDKPLAQLLSKIEYAPSAVLNLVYKQSDLKKPFNGFGFVVPQKEGRSIIACTFTNQKYAGRAPEETLLLRVFMGGALGKDIFAKPDHELIKCARQDLKDYLGIEAEPKETKLTRYPNSMPQYHLGHKELILDIQKLSSAYTGLAITGNYFNGPGIPDCIHTGELAAASVIESTLNAKIKSSIG